MPDPDPQPPQPRGMSVGRWLLLLLPSAPMLFMNPIAEALHQGDDLHGKAAMSQMVESLLITFAIAVVLSAVLGVQMERWKRGTVESIPRIIVYALNILFTACFVACGGCALVRKFSVL